MDKDQLIKSLEALITTDNPWGLQGRLEKFIVELKKTYIPAPMTDQQRKSIHLGFKFIADQLNEKGQDMKVILKPSVDIWWTKDSVKEYLYKPILKAYTAEKKTSTTEMDKLEPGEVWEIMMKFLGERHGVDYIPFPSDPTKDQNYQSASRKLEINYPTEEVGEPIL